MSSLKQTAMRVLGDKWYSKIIKLLNILNIGSFYRFDRRKFAKYAYGLSRNQDQVNLRSRITLNYHALEKGLTNINFRAGFGKKALYEIFSALQEYVAKDYDTSDVRFQTGLSVLKAYIDKHDEIGFPVDQIKRKFQDYSTYFSSDESIGGVISLKREDVLKNAIFDFDSFARSRHSVRDFSEVPVDKTVLESAFQTAETTPSVCNRQAWKTLVIEKGETLDRVLALQGGLSGNGRNIDKLLIVTTDNRYFYSAKERNQGYVDGGLYSMNLAYALHSHGVGTCMLNANLSLKNEKSVRNILGLHEATNIVMFIAVGSLLEHFKVPRSNRDSGASSSQWVV